METSTAILDRIPNTLVTNREGDEIPATEATRIAADRKEAKKSCTLRSSPRCSTRSTSAQRHNSSGSTTPVLTMPSLLDSPATIYSPVYGTRTPDRSKSCLADCDELMGSPVTRSQSNRLANSPHVMADNNSGVVNQSSSHLKTRRRASSCCITPRGSVSSVRDGSTSMEHIVRTRPVTRSSPAPIVTRTQSPDNFVVQNVAECSQANSPSPLSHGFSTALDPSEIPTPTIAPPQTPELNPTQAPSSSPQTRRSSVRLSSSAVLRAGIKEPPSLATRSSPRVCSTPKHSATYTASTSFTSTAANTNASGSNSSGVLRRNSISTFPSEVRTNENDPNGPLVPTCVSMRNKTTPARSRPCIVAGERRHGTLKSGQIETPLTSRTAYGRYLRSSTGGGGGASMPPPSSVAQPRFESRYTLAAKKLLSQATPPTTANTPAHTASKIMSPSLAATSVMSESQIRCSQQQQPVEEHSKIPQTRRRSLSLRQATNNNKAFTSDLVNTPQSLATPITTTSISSSVECTPSTTPTNLNDALDTSKTTPTYTPSIDSNNAANKSKSNLQSDSMKTKNIKLDVGKHYFAIKN